MSDFFRREAGVVDRLASIPPDQLAVSTVSVLEFEFGFARRPASRARYGALLGHFLSSVHLLPYGADDAVRTGRARALLAELGTPLGPFDIQIAGTALARRLVLVTHNTREFVRVPGLVLEDWRADA